MVVEGVSYQIDWRKFKRGTSIFIPCLDCAKARSDIGEVLTRLEIKFVSRISIEEGVQGLRIWRV
jgi:hypothetical protein